MEYGPDGMNEIKDLIAGANFSVMVRNSDRAVFVAGDNQSGQLGLAANQSALHVPVRSSF
jgi:alpha-tubulin suppressor-like RCC1 family protein